MCAAASADYRSQDNKDVRVLVVGATGYIGKFVVKELIKRGFDVVAFAREKSGIGGKASKDDTVKARHHHPCHAHSPWTHGYMTRGLCLHSMYGGQEDDNELGVAHVGFACFADGGLW